MSDTPVQRLARLVRRRSTSPVSEPASLPTPDLASEAGVPPAASDHSPRYPALRVATIGPVAAVPGGVETTDLTSRANAPVAGGQLHLDVVLVPGPSEGGPTQLDRATRQLLLACEEQDVPTVLVATRVSDLETDLAGLCRFQTSARTEVLTEARRWVGEEAVFGLPLAVDTRRFHPQPAGRSGDPRLSVIDDGAADVDTLLRAARRLGLEAERVAADSTDRGPTQLLEAATGAPTIAIAPGNGASDAAWRTAVALSALGHAVVAREAGGAPASDVLVDVDGGSPTARAVAAAGVDLGTLLPPRRSALLRHSPAAWLDALVGGIGRPVAPLRRVTAVVLVRGDRWLDRIRENLERQVAVDLDALLLTPRGIADQVADRAANWRVPTRVLPTDPHHTLGDRLDAGARRATGEWLTILEEGARYGPAHVLDLTLALEYTGADLVGCSERFVLDPEREVIGLVGAGSSRSRDARPATGTLLLRRETALRFGFLHDAPSADDLLGARIRAAGGTVYATDPHGRLLLGRLPAGHPDHRCWPERALEVALPDRDLVLPDVAPPLPSR